MGLSQLRIVSCVSMPQLSIAISELGQSEAANRLKKPVTRPRSRGISRHERLFHEGRQTCSDSGWSTSNGGANGDDIFEQELSGHHAKPIQESALVWRQQFV